MKTETIKKLRSYSPCREAVEWAVKQPNKQAAWDNCERGDWMLWLLGRLSGEPKSNSRKKLVLTACQCARLSLQYIPKDEQRPLRAIETAEAWATDTPGVTLEDVKAAAAYYAAYAAAAAADAAYAAAYAADAAYAAAAAADAAYAAAYAADAAYAAAAAKEKTLRQCADIVREYYPKAPRI